MWATFVISLVAVVMHQTLWCCRKDKCGIVWFAVISLLASIISAVFGAIMLTQWKGRDIDDRFQFDIAVEDDYVLACEPSLWYTVRGNRNIGYCPEQVFAIISFVCAGLWLAVTGCMVGFLANGRHHWWEEKWDREGIYDPTVPAVAIAEPGTLPKHPNRNEGKV